MGSEGRGGRSGGRSGESAMYKQRGQIILDRQYGSRLASRTSAEDFSGAHSRSAAVDAMASEQLTGEIHGLLDAGSPSAGTEIVDEARTSLHARVVDALEQIVNDSEFFAADEVQLFSAERSDLEIREIAERALYAANIGSIKRLATDIDKAIVLRTLQQFWADKRFGESDGLINENTKVLAMLHVCLSDEDRLLFLDDGQVQAIEAMTALRSDVVRVLMEADGLGWVYDKLWFLFEGVTDGRCDFRARRLNNNARVDGVEGVVLNQSVDAHLWRLGRALKYGGYVK